MKIYEDYVKNNCQSSIILNKPKDIYFMNVDNHGNILCNKHNIKKIPIFTKNYKKLLINCKCNNFLYKYINKFINIY